jgi:hypothetical protein
MSVAVMRMVGLALAATLTVSCDIQLSPDPPSSKSKSGSTSTKKPKPNPNPPPGVKHDLPKKTDDYSSRRAWENNAEDNCKKAGYSKDCLILTYNFKKREADGKLTRINDPGIDYYNNSDKNNRYHPCTVTKIDPPTSNSKKIPPKTKITVYVVCIPEEQSPSPTPSPTPNN